MRFIPVLTAILVTVFLFLLVIKRDALLEFAMGDQPPVVVAAPVPDKAGDSAVVSVVAVHSVAQVIDSAVVLRGQTEAARQVDVKAETSGQVISEPLRKGAFVSAGQLLCEIDPGTRAASLAEAEARLAEARARVPENTARQAEAEARLVEADINFNVASKLSKDGFASDTRVVSSQAAVSSARAAIQAAQSGLQAAQSGIQGAEASVAAARKEISRLSIVAPFEGLLESDSAEIGSLLQYGGLCATVIQLDPIKVVGFVPETAVNRVKVGALAGARLATGDEVQGRVSFLSRAADPSTRTFRAEIEVSNADLSIRDGQTAEILIAAEGAPAHLLPQSALTLNDDGVLGVRLVAVDKTALFAPVTLLRDTARGVWLAGLPDQADVIVIGQEYVTDGVPVRAVYQEATQ
jgi:multidrug efflux system membrane fusion protein